MSSYLSQVQVDKMLAPINPSRVGKDGKGFAHVEAYEIRATMNRLFGFARWSEEVTDQQLVFETGEDRTSADKKTSWTVWTVCYRSIVRLTVCAPDGTVLACYTEGATGEAKNQPGRADAHDLALKTSESQAFKRSAANLGDITGLSLWNKGSLKPLVFRTLHYPYAPDNDVKSIDKAAVVDAHITEPLASEKSDDGLWGSDGDGDSRAAR